MKIRSVSVYRFALLGALVALAPTTAFAQGEEVATGEESMEESTLSASASLDIAFPYVWRGQRYSEEPSLQPGNSIGVGGFSMGTWGNFELLDGNGQQFEFNEVDIWLEYGMAFGEDDLVGVALGLCNYMFPSSGGSTTELYLSLGLDAIIAPTLGVYIDFDGAPQSTDDGVAIYMNLGASYAQDLGPIGLEVFTSLGFGAGSYNAFYFGTEGGSLQDFNAGVSLGYGINEQWGLYLLGQYTTLLDGDNADVADTQVDGEYVGYYGAGGPVIMLGAGADL